MSQVQKIVIVSEVGILQDVLPQFFMLVCCTSFCGVGNYGKIWSAHGKVNLLQARSGLEGE